MTHTQMTLTDDQISALRAEAANAGDMMQVALCDIAIDGVVDHRVALTAAEVATLHTRFAHLSVEDARALARTDCADVCDTE